MGFCPMAWASPMLALMTSVKGLGTPCGDRESGGDTGAGVRAWAWGTGYRGQTKMGQD